MFVVGLFFGVEFYFFGVVVGCFWGHFLGGFFDLENGRQGW